jgi:hypothetical protein
MRWLNIRTFGVADAGQDMAIKPKVRANTLAFWKTQFLFICRIACMAGALS